MKKILISLSFVFTCLIATAQTGIGTPTPNPSAVLHIKASDKGVLIPQIELKSLTDEETIKPGNVNSLLVFNTTVDKDKNLNTGYYYWLEDKWERLATSSDAYANVYYDGDDFFYINENGDNVKIIIEDLIQANQKTYSVATADDYIIVTSEIDADNAPNHTTFNLEVTAAMPKFFYMPTLLFDTSTPGEKTMNLHDEYLSQFVGAKVKNPGAKVDIPHLPTATDLDYYITYFDETVINNVAIDDNGVVSYEVIGNAGPYSYMTVVFVVKDKK